MRLICIGFLCFTSILFTGCQSIGPQVLHNDRYQYNIALSKSAREELLLNIVRLRYDEPPMLLSVGNVSSSTSLNHALALSGSSGFFNGSSFGIPLSVGQISPSTGASYTDSPIISYTPLDDSSYTNRLLSSLSLQNINILLQSSWSINRVFRLVLQQAGHAVNASSAARPTSSHAPQYKAFLEVTSLFRRWQRNDQLLTGYSEKDGIASLTLYLNKTARIRKQDRLLLTKAGIELFENKIVFSSAPSDHENLIITRSTLGILSYLSKSVLVPENDVKNHLVALTYEKGKVFDWPSVLNGMMKINSSSTEPTQASIAIPYLNSWYYIDMTDSDSKQTLILLTNIIGLIASSPQSSPIGITRNV